MQKRHLAYPLGSTPQTQWVQMGKQEGDVLEGALDNPDCFNSGYGQDGQRKFKTVNCSKVAGKHITQGAPVWMLVQMQAELEWVTFPGTRHTLELSPATEPSAAVSYCGETCRCALPLSLCH